ncbi:hypothetical protein MKX01_034701 [Papaver californicum]|nr:hypothetical protein MKX01_034701 [Papaver californicum]
MGPSCQAANVMFCTAVATDVLMDRGWHYLAFPRCSKKFFGEDDELWGTKCEGKVMVRFEVEDPSGSAVFEALDSEVQKLVRHTAAELTGTSENHRTPLMASGDRTKLKILCTLKSNPFGCLRYQAKPYHGSKRCNRHGHLCCSWSIGRTYVALQG